MFSLLKLDNFSTTKIVYDGEWAAGVETLKMYWPDMLTRNVTEYGRSHDIYIIIIFIFSFFFFFFSSSLLFYYSSFQLLPPVLLELSCRSLFDLSFQYKIQYTS